VNGNGLETQITIIRECKDPDSALEDNTADFHSPQ